MTDDETRRRILVSALTNQAERYDAKARDLHMLNTRKPGAGFDVGAREYCRLAATARKIRDEIKEG